MLERFDFGRARHSFHCPRPLIGYPCFLHYGHFPTPFDSSLAQAATSKLAASGATTARAGVLHGSDAPYTQYIKNFEKAAEVLTMMTSDDASQLKSAQEKDQTDRHPASARGILVLFSDVVDDFSDLKTLREYAAHWRPQIEAACGKDELATATKDAGAGKKALSQTLKQITKAASSVMTAIEQHSERLKKEACDEAVVQAKHDKTASSAERAAQGVAKHAAAKEAKDDLPAIYKLGTDEFLEIHKVVVGKDKTLKDTVTEAKHDVCLPIIFEIQADVATLSEDVHFKKNVGSFVADFITSGTARGPSGPPAFEICCVGLRSQS